MFVINRKKKKWKKFYSHLWAITNEKKKRRKRETKFVDAVDYDNIVNVADTRNDYYLQLTTEGNGNYRLNWNEFGFHFSLY